MRKNAQTSKFDTRRNNELMCHEYYGQVLGIAALANHYGQSELPVDCDPSRYAEVCGGKPFTPEEYLSYLGEQGFDISKIRNGVELIQRAIESNHAKAKKFFEIFKREWFIEQADIEKYLDPLSIHHFIELVVADSASTKSRLKAIKRHTEHHSMKADLFVWLDSQTAFKSIEAAATAITKQQPITHVTARDWYKKWKKLRSAGTP